MNIHLLKERANSSGAKQSQRLLSTQLQQIIIFLVILQGLAQAQVFLTAQPQKPSTVYDGVTWEKYVTYLKLDGTQGVELPIDNQKIGQRQEYTLMLWFKASGENWGSKYAYAFEFQSSLQCYFSSNTLMCDSIQKCDKLWTDVSQISQNQWTHITVIGHPTYGSTLLLESNSKELASDQKGYVVLQQMDPTWKVCLGGCDGLFKFTGGFREFVYINKYVTKDTAKRLKNHYLLWDNNIVAYYRFTEKDFSKDEFKNNYAKITFQTSNSSKVIIGKDYIPNDICFPLNNVTQFLKFQSTVYGIPIDAKWVPATNGWEFSASLWVKIDSASCFTNNPNTAKSNCFLAFLQDAFMIFQTQPNYVAAYFFNPKPYYEFLSKEIFVPSGQWVNIQMGANQYNGYDLRTYDVLGRMMGYISEKLAFQPQKINSKSLQLFKNFQGLVKSVMIWTDRRPLPIKMPSVNITRGQYYNNDKCIAYFQFTADTALTLSASQMSFVNFCRHQYTSSTDIVVSSSSQFVGSYHADFTYDSGMTYGLITSSQKLFDGISCNDGRIVDYFPTVNSFVKATTQKSTSFSAGATVEFWFKAKNPVSSTNYLFSAYATNQRKEYLSIYYDQTSGNLLCFPLGFDSISSPYINYTDFTDANRQQYGWLHLVCQYESSDQTSKRLTGYLYKDVFGEHQYNSNSSFGVNMPLDQYEIYVANNNNESKGTANLLVREIRLWGYKRSYDDIFQWRYRQVDPRMFNASMLLTYLRLDEGYYDDYNFANILSPNISASVVMKNVQYQSDSDLVICPINTYYASDFSKCYQDPIDFMMPVVYMMKDITDNNYYWIFDSNFSVIVNPAFAPQVKVSWQFEDPIMRSIAKPQMNQTQMKIPVDAFRDESFYKVRLNLSNTDITFNKFQDIVFVPQSCQMYQVNFQTAYSVYNNYTNPQSTEDITFTIGQYQINTYCNSVSFFDTLVQQPQYQIVPQPSMNVSLNVTYLAGGSMQVTIPKREQYKLPTKTDLRIIFTLKQTNTQYQSYLQTQDLVFQHVVYTINFNTVGQTVMPFLTVQQPVLMRSDNAIFDATGTYITYTNQANRQANLTFSWTCPPGLSKLCENQTSNILNISSTDFTNNNGTFEKQLTFGVNILWSRELNGVTQQDTFSASQSIVWYNISTPTFTLFVPTQIKSTADNQKLQIQLNNYDVLNFTQLYITWSIVPNLTVQSLNLTSNNTVLTIPKGALTKLTTYTVTVTVTNVIQPLASRTQSQSFMTLSPPFGGTVSITPTVGVMDDTNFTISLQNWQSSQPPIIYKVWSTVNAGGAIKSYQLTQNWTQDNSTFTFKAINTYPLIVEISDESGEIITQSLNPSIQPKPQNFNKLTQLIKDPAQSIPDKYQYMTSLVSLMTSEPSQNVTNITRAEQISSRVAIVDQISKDIQMINNQKYIDSGDSYTIIKNSIQVLSTMLRQKDLMSDYIVTNVIEIMRQIQTCTTVYQKLLLQEDGLKNDFANTLAHLFSYAQQSFDTLLGTKRMLYNTSSIASINKIVEDIKDLKQTFVETLCSQALPDSPQQIINNEAFELEIEKFSKYSQAELRSFLFTDDQKSRINVHVLDLIKQMMKDDQNFESVCVQATYYKLPLYPLVLLPNDNITKYSDMLMEFEVVGANKLFNPNPFLDMYFAVYPETYKTDQSVCMAYSNQSKQWSSGVCNSQIDRYNYQLKCQCNMIDSIAYGVFTDYNLQPGEDLLPIKPKSLKNSTTLIVGVQQGSQSLSFIAVLAILFIFAVPIPLIAYILDKRDYKVATTMKRSAFDLGLLKKLEELSNQPYNYWVFKYDDVMNYSMQSKSLFSHIFVAIHPFISVFTKFDAGLSRFTRFSTYFLQVSLLALACVLVFGPWYREDSRKTADTVLDMEDINQILIVGIVGMFGLLPLVPTGCFKATKHQIKDNRVRIQNEVASPVGQQSQSQSININAPESTQEHNILRNQPTSILQTQSNPLDQQQQILNSQDYQKPVQRCGAGRVIIALLAYAVCFAAFALCIVLSITAPISNQYCMVASFYIGVFGSIFITNFLRVIFNSILADVIFNHSGGSLRCLKYLLAPQVVAIVQEVEWVHTAEKVMIEQDNKLLDPNCCDDDYGLNDPSNRDNSLKENDRTFHSGRSPVILGEKISLSNKQQDYDDHETVQHVRDEAGIHSRESQVINRQSPLRTSINKFYGSNGGNNSNTEQVKTLYSQLSSDQKLGKTSAIVHVNAANVSEFREDYLDRD